MRRLRCQAAATLCVLALLCVSAAGRAGPSDARPRKAAFAAGPTAARHGQGARITFALAAATDVEVAVLNAKGAVVRHLAAGALGGQSPPPAPLKRGLAQSLVWDGKDDAGRPAAGGPFRARTAKV